MSDSLRLADQVLDEKPPLDLMPRLRAPKNDLGILKKMVSIISPSDGSAPYGYASPYTKTIKFNVSADNAENHNDSFIKLKFTITNLSADGKAALLDGKIISFFKEAYLKQRNGTVLEDLKQVNRFRLSNDIQTSSPENVKFNFDSWKDNLVKDDSATAGAAANNNKVHILQGTEYVGILPVSDAFDFFKANPLWHSYRSGELFYQLTCEEDKFIFSTKEAAETTQPQLKITEANFHLINYDIDPVVREEVLKLPSVVYPFETYQVNSYLLTNGANNISWAVGDDNVVGLKLIGRKTKATVSQATGTLGGSPAVVRDLTRAEDLKITSLEVKAGGQKLQENPITSKHELYQYLKMYYNQQQDTDIGNLISHYNWDTENPALTEVQSSVLTTFSHHINLPLNINGKNTGWNCRAHPLQINITSGVATDDLIYLDVYCISSRVAHEQYGRIVVFH